MHQIEPPRKRNLGTTMESQCSSAAYLLTRLLSLDELRSEGLRFFATVTSPADELEAWEKWSWHFGLVISKALCASASLVLKAFTSKCSSQIVSESDISSFGVASSFDKRRLTRFNSK